MGVLGSGARNPYEILELGSQRGSIPSWLGGQSVLGRALGRVGRVGEQQQHQLEVCIFIIMLCYVVYYHAAEYVVCYDVEYVVYYDAAHEF